MRTQISVLITSAVLNACLSHATGLSYSSPFLRAELSPSHPAFEALSVDSLGKGKLSANLLHPPAAPRRSYALVRSGTAFDYFLEGAPTWRFEFSERRIRLRSRWTQNQAPLPVALSINTRVCHATLLGRMNEDSSIRLPALLHLPDFGTLRILATGQPDAFLSYDANRREGGYWVKVTFPAATKESPHVEYTLDVVNIHPGPAEVEKDSRFDGYRRNFLNALHINPRHKMLANHAASDPAPLSLFQYALVAARTPPLAEGLRATDLLRDTLDRYLAGAKGYGMPGYLPPDKERYPHGTLDTYPSLLISAGEYARSTGDTAWLARRYPAISAWVDRILGSDADGDGLMEFPLSGNSGSWPKELRLRPANWWDTIGFGHKDAYSNALAFRALLDMAEMAGRLGRGSDVRNYRAKAERLRRAYFRTFYNPATGVLAGWKSADGTLHDYYFTFVQGMAISLGLVTQDQANQLMNRLLAKMEEVGYNRFDLGLPGNLIPVRRDDYVEPRRRYGGSTKDDGSDGFQIYENGGATACHVYWTLQALYKLGRRQEADRMLFPLLEAFENGGFQGFGPNGFSKDWKAWDGAPNGYEGLLADSYLALLAVYTGWAKR